MDKPPMIDRVSFIVAIAFFIFSFFLFYNQTSLFSDSLVAALIGSFMIWGSYITIRICILTARR